MRAILFIPLAMITVLPVSCSAPPRPNDTYQGAIDVINDPAQEPPAAVAAQTIMAGGYTFTITPRADYVIGGIVIGREKYSGGWNSLLSPCDLAIAWGKLVQTGLHKKLNWSQNGRWYFWNYGPDFPFDNTFVARYSSNNHIIPANQNIRIAALALDHGDSVELCGQLVDIDGRKGDATVWWHTSTSRDDGGDGSCEVFYVRRIKHQGSVYE